MSASNLTVGESALLTDFAMCVNHYRLSTPGLYVCVETSVRLDENTVVTPGMVAQVNAGIHKQCEVDGTDHFVGPPNFVFDVFRKDGEDEYRERYSWFERAGVIEYVAWFLSEPVPRWNRLVDGKFMDVSEDETGLVKSRALPGLWMPVAALKDRDWWQVMAAISRGVTRRGHRDFMRTIWKDTRDEFSK